MKRSVILTDCLGPDIFFFASILLGKSVLKKNALHYLSFRARTNDVNSTKS